MMEFKNINQKKLKNVLKSLTDAGVSEFHVGDVIIKFHNPHCCYCDGPLCDNPPSPSSDHVDYLEAQAEISAEEAKKAAKQRQLQLETWSS